MLIRLRLNAQKEVKGIAMPSKKNALKVYLAPDEFQLIMASAERSGLSMSTFAKRVCLGSPVPILESEKFRTELRKAIADLGRLGGLFKLWLSTPDTPEPELRPEVRRILREIESRQREIQAVVAKL